MSPQEDIIINLPQGVKLNTLTSCPEFSGYSSLMQRTVVILLTSDNPDLTMDGMTLPQMLEKVTTSGIKEVRALSGHFARILKRMLNADENEVESITIDIGETFPVVVTINITKTNNTEISGEFTYE